MKISNVVFDKNRAIKLVAILLCISFAMGCAVSPLQGMPSSQAPVNPLQINSKLNPAEENLIQSYQGRRHGKWGKRGGHRGGYRGYPNIRFIRGVVAATVVMVLLLHSKDRTDY